VSTRPRIDPVIRLDFLLAFLVTVASVLVFGVRLADQAAANARELRRTSAILDDLERRIRSNEHRIEYLRGLEDGRRSGHDSPYRAGP